MGLPKPLALPKETFYVYKTGLPFYDAARLIGVAHLFFGTASAEVEDKGSHWEIRGPAVLRDENQIVWILQRLRPTDKEQRLFYKNHNSTSSRFLWDELRNYFSNSNFTTRQGRLEELKAEYDVALQIGTRGLDPLAKYEVLAPRSTGETRKKFKQPFQEVAAATLGRAFAARVVSPTKGFRRKKGSMIKTFAARVVSPTKRQRDTMYILPIFRERFVISGFLTYEREFSHSGGGWIAAVQAALSILLDLTAKRLPVSDFAYTREVKGPTGQPIFSSSGYLGLERLCSYWWRRVVEEGNSNALRLLKEFRLFLANTASLPATHSQVQDLARWVADFVANPNVDALVKIQQLKARIMVASQGQSIQGGYWALQLLNRSQNLEEVKKMMAMQLPEVPWQVSEALAKALGFDEKGWMNQFTRLENAGTFSQFIQQIEHIISRGYYREQQESGQNPDIRQALTRARNIAEELRKIESQLRDERSFRAWKAIFLLDVLSHARFQRESAPESGEASASEEASESKTEEG